MQVYALTWTSVLIGISHAHSYGKAGVMMVFFAKVAFNSRLVNLDWLFTDIAVYLLK